MSNLQNPSSLQVSYTHTVILTNTTLQQPPAAAAIVLPSAIPIPPLNATTVNNTLNSVASAAFSQPPPPPIDYSPITQLSASEWVIVGTIFSMLITVTSVILWQVWKRQRQRRLLRKAVASSISKKRGMVHNIGKVRGVGWRIEESKALEHEDVDVDVMGLTAPDRWFGNAERYVYRLSHAMEVIRQK